VLPAPNSHGLTVQQLTEVNERLLDVVVQTDAIFQPVHVKIYLPAGYWTDTGQRYSTLYLMHGGGSVVDNASSWIEEGNAPAIVDQAGYSGIVVMPEAGKAGWFTDWAGPDFGGRQPKWEAFHIGQLLPWIDANFRTVADGAHRAIAGLSMGGFGALSYAARHPDLFSRVGSLSGDTNIALLPAQAVMRTFVSTEYGTAITNSQKQVQSYLAPDIQDVFGPFPAWGAHNPFDLAGRYRPNGIQIAMYAGTGFDSTGFDFFESLAKSQADAMHFRLRLLGNSDRYCAGSGAHVWAYWQADLADFLQWLSGATPSSCPSGWGQPQA